MLDTAKTTTEMERTGKHTLEYQVSYGYLEK